MLEHRLEDLYRPKIYNEHVVTFIQNVPTLFYYPMSSLPTSQYIQDQKISQSASAGAAVSLAYVHGDRVEMALGTDDGRAHIPLSEPVESSTAQQGEILHQSAEDRVFDHEATPPQEDDPARRETDDLETVHPVPSGPLYSVFTEGQRKYIVFMVACGGFFSPLSANIYFPALNSLSKDLKVSSELINLSLTTYMIFQGLAPTVFGDLADMIGRRPVYILGFIVYIGANIGLALQKNYAALLVLRCLQSSGSSGTVALGNGVVADIASSGERGKFIGTVDAHSFPIPNANVW